MPPSGALWYLWALLWSKVWSLLLRKCFQQTGEVFISVDISWIICCVYIDHLRFPINIILNTSVILVLRLVTGNVSMRVSAFWYVEHRAWGYLAIRWENLFSSTIQHVFFHLFFIFLWSRQCIVFLTLTVWKTTDLADNNSSCYLFFSVVKKCWSVDIDAPMCVGKYALLQHTAQNVAILNWDLV